MKKIPTLLCLAIAACSSPTQKETAASDTLSVASGADTSTVANTSIETQEPLQETVSPEPDPTPTELSEFIKHPFESDYAAVKQSLMDDSVEVKAVLSAQNGVLSFGDSRIDFLIADEQVQSYGLGDLICSADISYPKFSFNSDVTIGMDQSAFLERFNVDISELRDSEGKMFFDREIPFDNGHWKMTVWFDKKKLSRFTYEISPCEYDLSD